MASKIIDFFHIITLKLKNKANKLSANSMRVTEVDEIQKFINEVNNPFLISFPRTGSHWLRMMMELYFEQPSLVRVFYYKDRKNYLTYHTHDLDFSVYRKNVIYLYRNPAPTIYSQMMYNKENLYDIKRVQYWTRQYGKHLKKWLIDEQVSQHKTILKYENLVNDIDSEFLKLANHFGYSLNPAKLQQVVQQVSSKEVKKKTQHDRQVISKNDSYNNSRREFISQNQELIDTLILETDPKLSDFLECRK